jgi:Ca2+-binding EF-hand superfamily protein
MALVLSGWLLFSAALSQPPNRPGKDKRPRRDPTGEPKRPDRPDQPRPPRPDGKPPGPGEDRRPEILRKYDRDRDGRLDEEERARLVEDMKRKRLSKEDIAQQLERLAVLERFDKDGDGRLNEEELAAAREALDGGKPIGDEPKKRPASKKQQETLDKYDADGDGKLSAAEKAQIQKDIKAKRDEAARQKAEEKKRKKTG